MPALSSSASARTDLSALRFNGFTVVGVTLTSLTLTLPALTLGLGAAMLLGAVRPDLSPLRAVYRLLGSSLGLKPEVVEEDPRAHHFAQGVGGTFLLASGVATVGGLPVLGGTLGALVTGLALLNLSQRLCVGCLMYFQYRRLRYQLLQRRTEGKTP